MGIIAQVANKALLETANKPGHFRGVSNAVFDHFPEIDRSRHIWREVFNTAKEDGDKDKFPRVRPTPGGSWGRSAIASPESYKRLLEAMRSMAPGGWSDDRYEQSRHFVGIAYVAIHRICTQMMQAEFNVYRKSKNHPDGKVSIEEDDPAYPLVKLLERPNKKDSFGKLLYRVLQQKMLTGKSLLWMVPNRIPNHHPDEIYQGAGTPFELYVVPTAIAIPQPAINPDYPDGYYRIQPLYPYGPFSSYPTPASAVGAPIPAQWMLEFQYPHPLLRYDGYSPLSGLRLHMDEVESMDRSRWYNMKRVFKPNAVLNMDEMEGQMALPEEELERLHAEWENQHEGPENFGRLFVAPPGGKLEEFGSRPIDMDYQQGWDQLTSFIMGGLGITKPASGMIEDSSYSTLFATLKQLHAITLDPECQDLSQEITHHLAPFFGKNLLVEIRCKRIDDHELKMNKLSSLCQYKGLTVNELRRELDFEETEEDWGKERVGAEPQQGQPGAGGMPGMPGMEGQPGAEMGGQPGAEMQPGTEGQPGAEGAMEEANQLQQGNEQLMQEAGAGTEEPQSVEDQLAELQRQAEGEEGEEERPTPGKLGEGALGPRKALKFLVKTLRDRYRKPVLNGFNGSAHNGFHKNGYKR